MTMGYANGSDLLLDVAGKCVGHCTSHTITYNAESKERSVKPVATASTSAGLYSEKSISKLSISISAEGLRNYDETENGFKPLLTAFKTAQPVELKAFGRGKDTEPYLVGNFVITSLVETNPAQDDATYSVSLENSGEPSTFDPTQLPD